jgi:hypothetical protein
MPIPLKNAEQRVDTGVMSDAVLSPNSALSTDSDLPQLGEPIAPTLPTTAPAPVPLDPTPVPTLTVAPVLGEAPTLPSTAPVLPAAAPTPPAAPAVTLPDVPPVLTSDEVPSLPTPVAPTVTPVAAPDETDDDGEPRHPMAHLMPTKNKPNEASIRAAEARAAQKAKGKKIKLGIAAGTLVFIAVVGPPVYKWTANAINEAGNTSTEDVAD